MVTESAVVVGSLKDAGRSRPRLGPYSTAGPVAALDGRSCEYRYYKTCRDAFLAYIGTPPTVVQRELIEQAAWLKVRIGMMNKRLAEDGGVRAATDGSDSAWINALSRILMLLDFTCGTGGELAAAEARHAAFEALHSTPRGGQEIVAGVAGDDR
jgi:hypothetical protein